MAAIQWPRDVPPVVRDRFRTASGRYYRPGQFMRLEHAAGLADLLTAWMAEQREQAVEWELGVDYREREGYHHEKGRSSDVMVNVRIAKTSGEPATAKQALRAILHVAATGHLQDGWRAEVVQWSRGAGQRWRHGTEADLESFRAILARVGGHGTYVRMGRVKETILLPDALMEWLHDLRDA
jgi:hypothetical protein